jgi:hypothetical protein
LADVFMTALVGGDWLADEIVSWSLLFLSIKNDPYFVLVTISP